MSPARPPRSPRRLATLGLLLAPLLIAATGPAAAHGPTRQKVVEEIAIAAPAAAVWARIRNFDALKDWHPAVAASPATQGNQAGSVRQLTLQGGGALTETLEGHDDPHMKYSYRAKDGGALPVTNYTSTLTVKPDGETRCSVEWRGAFYRGYPNNDPPPDQNDEAAVRAVTGVYQSGLANLKKLVEGR
jgi:carbon monoxide dehydrogenase subunit G